MRTNGTGKRRTRNKADRRAHMIAIRPPAPNRQHGLYAPAPEGQRDEAEVLLYQHHPHLRAERDAPRVRSLAALDVLCENAWRFFLEERKRIAHATGSGRVTWNPGLSQLLKLERQRLELARELLATPKARREAGLPITREEEAIDLDTIKKRYSQASGENGA